MLVCWTVFLAPSNLQGVDILSFPYIYNQDQISIAKHQHSRKYKICYFQPIMATSNTTPRIIQLAEAISDSVAKLKAILGEDGLPSSFSEETELPALSQEASDLRDAVIDATSDLQDLLLDPLNLLTKYAAVGSDHERVF